MQWCEVGEKAGSLREEKETIRSCKGEGEVGGGGDQLLQSVSSRLGGGFSCWREGGPLAAGVKSPDAGGGPSPAGVRGTDGWTALQLLGRGVQQG